MADDPVNEDQWLYGDSNPDQNEDESNKFGSSEKISDNFLNPVAPTTEDGEQPSGAVEPPVILPPGEEPAGPDESKNGDNDAPEDFREQLQIDEGQEPVVAAAENGEAQVEGGGEFDDDDDSDDDVNVVIGDIKTAPQYNSLNIKRGGLLTSTGVPPQLKQPGKFSIDEFETIGTINGVPAHEFNLDNLEEKPWRKPGADITDYFNYGFNEETWRAYCERQKRMRVHESGVGLGPISTAATGSLVVGRGNLTMPIVNDNSKYAAPGAGALLMRKAGPPPGRRVAGAIDVIGGTGLASRRTNESPPKENIIQVMTADRREYSRKGYPDVTVPPPGIPPATIPPIGFPIETPPPHIAPPTFGANYNPEFYQPDVDPYYNAYEPTQDLQWGASGSWEPAVSGDVKVVVGGSETSNQDSQDASRKSGASPLKSDTADSIKIKQEPDSPDRSRQRDRDRDRHRESRSHRRRTRSHSRSPERRSRKHKSRSRSPSHRHKKKKSKKSDRSKEDASD